VSRLRNPPYDPRAHPRTPGHSIEFQPAYLRQPADPVHRMGAMDGRPRGWPAGAKAGQANADLGTTRHSDPLLDWPQPDLSLVAGFNLEGHRPVDRCRGIFANQVL